MPTTSWTSQGPLCQKTWTYFGRLKDLCGKKRLDCKESISEPVKGKGYRCEISVKLQHSARQVFTVVGEIKMKKQDAKHSAAEKAIKELSEYIPCIHVCMHAPVKYTHQLIICSDAEFSCTLYFFCMYILA